MNKKELNKKERNMKLLKISKLKLKDYLYTNWILIASIKLNVNINLDHLKNISTRTSFFSTTLNKS